MTARFPFSVRWRLHENFSRCPDRLAGPGRRGVPRRGRACGAGRARRVHVAQREYVGSIKQDVGLTTGAKVVGNRLFVTSGKNISIYDISDPAIP